MDSVHFYRDSRLLTPPFLRILLSFLVLFETTNAFNVAFSTSNLRTGSRTLALRMQGGRDGDQKTLTLHDGTKHPMIGFGTYKVGFIPASASSASANPASAAAGPSARECVR